MHTTLNPKGPGAVRIHLIPPKWRPFSDAPYVMILNGYYILPLGYSWAILLRNFIREVNVYDGRPINEAQMKQVMDKAVSLTKRVYYVKTQELQEDLQEMLDLLYGVARGGEPSGNIGPLSLREYAANMTAMRRDSQRQAQRSCPPRTGLKSSTGAAEPESASLLLPEGSRPCGRICRSWWSMRAGSSPA